MMSFAVHADLTVGLSWAMALAAPNTAAHPPMSNFISSIMLPAPAFRLYPPLENTRKKRDEKEFVRHTLSRRVPPVPQNMLSEHNK